MSDQGLEGLLAEYDELESALSDPAVHADQARARKLGRRYAELTPVVRTQRELDHTRADLGAARELAADDPAFSEEAERLGEQVTVLEERLTEQLLPRDPHDAQDLVVEIKSGEGGEESALFAADLLRMYSRYAEKRGWGWELLDSAESELGGFKELTLTVTNTKAAGPDEGVWARMKFEGGVHRVQRVPVTESQGRIHTSAAGVLVYPQTEDTGEVAIHDDDLRVDVFRASGKGGQGVNTTDSAVRLTHLPTGIVVSCQNERSQLQNRIRAMQVLRSRLQAMAEERAEQEAADARRSQVRTVDRSERVRTYNFPENRISDHRVNFKAYNLDQVLAGEMDAVLDALAAADRQERLDAAAAGTG